MESRRCRQWSKRSETMECMVDETAFIYYDTDRVMLISGYAFFYPHTFLIQLMLKTGRFPFP